MDQPTPEYCADKLEAVEKKTEQFNEQHGVRIMGLKKKKARNELCFFQCTVFSMLA